jgi:hypothetical protein
MNEMDLQTAIRTPDFVNKFRSDEITALLTGKFSPGKVPYLHTVTLPDGSKIVLRFTNTIRYMLDSKLKRRTDRESYLSYMQLIVQPVGMKAYHKVFEPKLILIEAPTEKAAAKHAKALADLKEIAATYGISLESPNDWSTVFDENYKK